MRTIITTPNKPEVEQISYNFPTLNKSFLASSQQEAEQKKDEWLKSQSQQSKTEIKTPNLLKDELNNEPKTELEIQNTNQNTK